MKRVALTFDDGPNGKCTSDILETLKKHKIKASFFFLGKNVERSPDIAKQTREEGHLIENHTYDHPHLNTLKPEDILLQIEKCEDIFKKILGITPKFFRAPYGEHNDIVDKIINDKGYMLVDWDRDCYSKDWLNPPVDTIVRITTDKARDGSILLLHDGRNIRVEAPRENTLRALPEIIGVLKKRRFKIIRLDELCQR